MQPYFTVNSSLKSKIRLVFYDDVGRSKFLFSYTYHIPGTLLLRCPQHHAWDGNLLPYFQSIRFL